MKYKILTILLVIVAFGAGIIFGPRLASAPKIVMREPTADSSVLQISLVTIDVDTRDSPTIKVEYPQFPTLDKKFNNEIKHAVESRLSLFRQSIKENNEARLETSNGSKDSIPMQSYTFYTTWSPAELDMNKVSFILRFESYVGGANAGEEIQTFNFDIKKSADIYLADVFVGVPEYLTKISTIARRELANSLTQASPGYDPSDNLNSGTAPVAENFSAFTMKDDVITFYFPKYAVAPGAFGEQKFSVPIAEIK